MALSVRPTALPEVLLVESTVFADDRGFFTESFNLRDFTRMTGLTPGFVQDNHSRSLRGVLRGLHYQIQHPQGKLVRVLSGEIFDVAVDLRRDSPRFGQWVGEVISSDNQRQIWIPEGFGHGFLVMGDRADVLYKTTDYRYPEHERCLVWNDPTLGIDWPLTGAPVLSAKDAQASRLQGADVY